MNEGLLNSDISTVVITQYSEKDPSGLFLFNQVVSTINLEHLSGNRHSEKLKNVLKYAVR